MGKTEEFHAAYESAVDKIRTGFGQKHPMIIDGQETWATSTFDDLCPADTKIVLGLFQKGTRDRKSTRLNSSHSQISYAVFCLKKKKHAPILDMTIATSPSFADRPDAPISDHLSGEASFVLRWEHEAGCSKSMNARYGVSTAHR